MSDDDSAELFLGTDRDGIEFLLTVYHERAAVIRTIAVRDPETRRWLPEVELHPGGGVVNAGPAIAKALAALQAELPNVRKEQTANVKSERGSYSYTYAGLPNVTAAVMPLLAKHGLSFVAPPRRTEHGYALVGLLLHESGECIEGEYPLPASATPQQIGSAITYGRRYLLGALTGVVTDDDDDGQLAQHAQRLATTPPDDPWYGNTPASPKTASDKQLAAMHSLFTEVGVPKENREGRLLYASDVLGRQVESSKELTFAEGSRVIEALKAELADIQAGQQAGQQVQVASR